VYGILKTKEDVSETKSVSVLGCGGETPTVLVPLERSRLVISKGPNRIGVPPPEDGNRSCFRNVVFSSF
jgi:hypothetical protein